jgi:hypothetical protein
LYFEKAARRPHVRSVFTVPAPLFPSDKEDEMVKNLSQLQNELSSPKAELNVHNAVIGDMVFQTLRTIL